MVTRPFRTLTILGPTPAPLLVILIYSPLWHSYWGLVAYVLCLGTVAILTVRRSGLAPDTQFFGLLGYVLAVTVLSIPAGFVLGCRLVGDCL